MAPAMDLWCPEPQLGVGHLRVGWLPNFLLLDGCSVPNLESGSSSKCRTLPSPTVMLHECLTPFDFFLSLMQLGGINPRTLIRFWL